MTTTTLSRQKPKRTLKSFFPIVSWLPNYKAAWLQPDTIAALTVWALLVPEAMAYAGIAGMPPRSTASTPRPWPCWATPSSARRST
jgi:hypothetical protein